MAKKLTVVPERCSGCHICELVCALRMHGVNNPKKSAIRVMVVYPQPVIRMPIVCRQCKDPKCRENCPTDAVVQRNGVVEIDKERCISCSQCVTSCPFGAVFVHDDLPTPFKCDLCGGDPQCVKECPKKALLFVPEFTLGQEQRLAGVLKYVHMREVEYYEKGEIKKLRYAEIEGDKGED